MYIVNEPASEVIVSVKVLSGGLSRDTVVVLETLDDSAVGE